MPLVFDSHRTRKAVVAYLEKATYISSTWRESLGAWQILTACGCEVIAKSFPFHWVRLTFSSPGKPPIHLGEVNAKRGWEDLEVTARLAQALPSMEALGYLTWEAYAWGMFVSSVQCRTGMGVGDYTFEHRESFLESLEDPKKVFPKLDGIDFGPIRLHQCDYLWGASKRSFIFFCPREVRPEATILSSAIRDSPPHLAWKDCQRPKWFRR